MTSDTQIDLSQGTKADSEKVRLDLLPPAPLVEIAKTLTFGANKYAAYNWSKGMNQSRLFAAALRHLWAWWAGQDNDPEAGTSHLANAGFCILVMLDQQLSNKKEFDDRPVGSVAVPNMIYKKPQVSEAKPLA